MNQANGAAKTNKATSDHTNTSRRGSRIIPVVPRQLARRPEAKKPAAPVVDVIEKSLQNGLVDNASKAIDGEDRKCEETGDASETAVTVSTPASSAAEDSAKVSEDAPSAQPTSDIEQTGSLTDVGHSESDLLPSSGDHTSKAQTPQIDPTPPQTEPTTPAPSHSGRISFGRFDPLRDEFVSHPNGASAANMSTAASDGSRPSSQHTSGTNGQSFSVQSPNGYSATESLGYSVSTPSSYMNGGVQQQHYPSVAPYGPANGSGSFTGPPMNPPYVAPGFWSQPPHNHQARQHPFMGSPEAPNGFNEPSRSASQASIPNEFQQLSHPNQAHQIPQTQPSTYQFANQFGQPSDLRQYHSFAPGDYNSTHGPDAGGTTLVRYLEANFGEGEFADTSIHVQSPSGDTLRTINAHALILAQSSELRSLLRSQDQTRTNGKRELYIPASFYFSHVDAFSDVVRSLYHQRLLDDISLWRRSSLDTRRPDLKQQTQPRSDDTLEYLLSYMASSCRLGLPHIAYSASYLVYKYLNWPKLDLALRYTLHGGLNQSWWFNACGGQRLNPPLAHAVGQSRPTYEPFAEPILCQVIDFVTSNLPLDFELDTTVAQLAGTQRFPSALTENSAASHAPKGSISNPRLKTLRLGEFPVDDAQPRLVISSILLSVPFPVLKALLEHPVLEGRLGQGTLTKHIRAVIAERENHRSSAWESLKKQPALLQQDVFTPLQRQTFAIKEAVTEIETITNGMRIDLGQPPAPRQGRPQLSFSHDSDIDLDALTTGGT